MEALLLYSGPMIPPKMREHIEISLAQALLCLNKGVLPLQPPNRHLKRCLSPEALRQSPTLQKLIIQLSMTDVLTPGSDSVVSGNMSLLRSVCQSCLLQSDTSVDAARALCVIDAVLFPSAVTLPANHHVLLNRKIAQMNDSGTSAYTTTTTNNSNPSDSAVSGVHESVPTTDRAKNTTILSSSSSSMTVSENAKSNVTTTAAAAAAAAKSKKVTNNNSNNNNTMDINQSTKAPVGISFKRNVEAMSVTNDDAAATATGFSASTSQKGIEMTTLATATATATATTASGQQSKSASARSSKKAKVATEEEEGDLELPDIQF